MNAKIISLSQRLESCFGKRVVDLVKRVSGAQNAQADSEAREEDVQEKLMMLHQESIEVKEMEVALERFAPRPVFYFDCSMLQTQEVVEG